MVTANDEGLLCIDCHLIVSETEIGDGHGQRMHTFSVDMGTCSKCHIDNLHQGGVDMGIDDEARTGAAAMCREADEVACLLLSREALGEARKEVSDEEGPQAEDTQAKQ